MAPPASGMRPSRASHASRVASRGHSRRISSHCTSSNNSRTLSGEKFSAFWNITTRGWS